ncbi:PREDICTED: uncharacterized protein LOC105112223 [Populus euphratica]|uniref:Uncharacterized protein LOC105112223 n=1 Tax=Populus euphratica TaxID=75702 RepID=A0AAJ6T8F4_POPEU|nr:PREDICTED: uncharacterized protein LOC105112223 [Populus euphratica]
MTGTRTACKSSIGSEERHLEKAPGSIIHMRTQNVPPRLHYIILREEEKRASGEAFGVQKWMRLSVEMSAHERTFWDCDFSLTGRKFNSTCAGKNKIVKKIEQSLYITSTSTPQLAVGEGAREKVAGKNLVTIQGVWRVEGKEIRNLIINPIKLGYRHFDCVADHKSEAIIGEVLEAFKTVLAKREDLFITTKYPPSMLVCSLII